MKGSRVAQPMAQATEGNASRSGTASGLDLYAAPRAGATVDGNGDFSRLPQYRFDYLEQRFGVASTDGDIRRVFEIHLDFHPGPGPQRSYHRLEWADESFMDMSHVHSAILGDYRLVKDNFQLGDVILFRKSDDEVVHACNFIADDIVFTKNGQSRGRPWVLMHMQDVIDMYSAGDPLNMVVLRHK